MPPAWKTPNPDHPACCIYRASIDPVLSSAKSCFVGAVSEPSTNLEKSSLINTVGIDSEAIANDAFIVNKTTNKAQRKLFFIN